jgi:hypothetical protein
VYGDSIDLLMNSMTYEPMFMLAILPVAAMGAIASVIDDDAARWINGSIIISRCKPITRVIRRTLEPISDVAKEISLYAQ